MNLPAFRPPEGDRPLAALTHRRTVTGIPEDLLDLFRDETMPGDVLDVAVGVVFIVPDDRELSHRSAPLSSHR